MKKTILITAMLLVCGAVLTSCSVDGVRPSGNFITEERNVSDYNEIEVSGGIKVNIIPMVINSGIVKVRTDDNIAGHIETYVHDGKLVIRKERRFAIMGSYNVNVDLFVEGLTEISASGGSTVRSNEDLSGRSLEIELSGGSLYHSSIDVDRLSVELSGGSRAEFSGNCTDMEIDASGGSVVTGYGMNAYRSDIELSGGSSVKLSVEEYLKVEASGGSNVYYHGSPRVEKKLSGGSKVIQGD